MRTRKIVSLGTNEYGETRFVTQSGKAVSSSEEDKSKRPRLNGVLGSRSVVSSTAVTDKVMRPAPPEPAEDERALETADAFGSGGFGAGAPGGTSVSTVVSANMLAGTLDGTIGMHNPEQPSVMLNRIYRDMYYTDATCGSAVDLLATIPFSPFNLTGLQDERLLSVFVDSLESMNIDTLLPQMCIDYNVLGVYVGSPAWDSSQKRYAGLINHNLDNLHFVEVPLNGVDPLVFLKVAPNLSKFLGNAEASQKYEKFFPRFLIDHLRGTGTTGAPARTNQGIELEPEHTIFIPRTNLTQNFSGMSLYRRALAAWFYEKALITGTIDQVYKRQRATTHITVDETETFTPDQEELDYLSNLFMSADLDPLGAVVATRAGVSVNEVRQAESFWRWDQTWSQIETIKLRALGISESLVTGEAQYSSMEQTLSVFMEQVRDFRNRVTRELFYDKLFPMIAQAHNITRKRYGRVSTLRAREVGSIDPRAGYSRNMRYDDNYQLTVEIGGAEYARSNKLNMNINEYVIPELRWNKRLLPEGDAEYIGIMQSLEQLGAPITMRGIMAAGGLQMEKVLAGLPEDLEARRQIAEYKKELNEINKIANPEGGEEGADDLEEAALIRQRMNNGSVRRLNNLASRFNPDTREAEFAALDSRGHRRVLTAQGRKYIADKFATQMGRAAAEIVRQENARTLAEMPDRTRTYSYSRPLLTDKS